MKTKEEIQAHLDANVNTLLGQHGGRVDITDVEDLTFDKDGQEVILRTAIVVMSGGCRGCAGAKATLKSIVSSQVKEFDPTVQHLIDDTDHTDKSNAFFKE